MSRRPPIKDNDLVYVALLREQREALSKILRKEGLNLVLIAAEDALYEDNPEISMIIQDGDEAAENLVLDFIAKQELPE